MSTFSDRLNTARGDESIRSVARRAATKTPVGESTLYPYFRDGHPRPTMAVVVALALALKIPSEELRELADIPAEGHPWMPPQEARYMNDRQRHAVDELIRSIVATRGATHADRTDQANPSTAAARTPNKAGSGEKTGEVSRLADHQRKPLPLPDTAAARRRAGRKGADPAGLDDGQE